MKVSPYELKRRQAWPLKQKVEWALKQIRIWYDYWDGKVYVSFSGGKDSTVLLDIVRSLYPEVPAVFCNTGLEFPEIISFVRETPNVVWLKPKMTYRAVIEKHGWPVISKEQAMAINRYRNTKFAEQKRRRLEGFPMGKRGTISKCWRFMIDAPFKISEACCDVMKKRPFAIYEKGAGLYAYIGTMVSDSRIRALQYQNYGCNAFDLKKPKSAPLSIWTTTDAWAYIRENNIQYSSIYDMGYNRTGCVFCAFGVHMEETPNRFQRLKETHPRLWHHCMDTLGLREVLAFIDVPIEPPSIISRDRAFDKVRRKLRSKGVSL